MRLDAATPRVERRESGGISVVAPLGEHDLATADAIRREIAVDPDRPVVVDLSAASFVDSSVLGVLVEAQQISTDRGRAFAIVLGPEPAESVRRVLEITGLLRKLPIHETLDSARLALAAAGEPPPA